jgi:LytTr DNA-binding domain
MALIEVTPSDEMRVILCFKFDRRAPFDAVLSFKRALIDCACVVHSVETSGAFDYMIEAALPDFAAYHGLLGDFAVALSTVVERHEASFVCRRFLRTANREHAIWVPCRDGRRRIECAAIDLVRAEGDYVCLHCGAQRWLLHDTMHHMRELLDPHGFLTLHRSTIVNADFIDRLVHRRTYWIAILHDGSEQRIAKRHVVGVLAALRNESSMPDDRLAIRGRPGENSAQPVEEALKARSASAIVS